MGWAMFELFRNPFFVEAGVQVHLLVVECVKTGSILKLSVSSREVCRTIVRAFVKDGEILAQDAEEIEIRIANTPMCEDVAGVIDKLAEAGSAEFDSRLTFRLHECEKTKWPHGHVCVRANDGVIERRLMMFHSLQALMTRLHKDAIGNPDVPIEELRAYWRVIADAKRLGLALSDPDGVHVLNHIFKNIGLEALDYCED